MFGTEPKIGLTSSSIPDEIIPRLESEEDLLRTLSIPADQPQQPPDQLHQQPEQPDQQPDQPEQQPDQPDQKPEHPYQQPEQPDQQPYQPQQQPEQPDQQPDQPQQQLDQPEQHPDQLDLLQQRRINILHQRKRTKECLTEQAERMVKRSRIELQLNKSQSSTSMGCDTSKSSKNQDQEVTNNNADVFTDNQIDTLRSTWPLLARNLDENGIRVFRLVFLTEPNIKNIFKLPSNLNDDDIYKDPLFHDHVHAYMSMIGHVVENLDNNKEEVEKNLLILGAKHATFYGFTKDYFRTFTMCTLEVWESVIAEEFIAEVRESWETLLAYIVRYMDKGYTLYHQEQSCSLMEEEDVEA